MNSLRLCNFGFQDNKHQIADWYLLMFVCEVCLSVTSNDIQMCVVEEILLCHIMLVVLPVCDFKCHSEVCSGGDSTLSHYVGSTDCGAWKVIRCDGWITRPICWIIFYGLLDWVHHVDKCRQFRRKARPEGGSSSFICNIGTCMANCMASQVHNLNIIHLTRFCNY
jgi:hypothetical protein